MSWKVHGTEEAFAALRGLCSNSYRMYDPSEYRYYYDHDCETYECAVEDAAREYARLLKHCKHQKQEIAKLMHYHIKDGERTMDERKTDDERTKTEQNGVITDELREYSKTTTSFPAVFKELTDIADRIDERHRRDMATAQQVGINEGEDAAMREGWVKLPVDADGVPIHVGDVMEGEKIGGGFGEPFEVVGYIMSNGELEPMDENKCPRKHVYLRHIQPDSWERIIGDALTVGWANDSWSEVASAEVHDRLVERCRRLAGDGK